jgi:hypothetical protein
MTTFTWRDYTPTPEEEEAWRIMEKEAERNGLIKAEQVRKEIEQENRKTVWIGEFEFFEAEISRDKYQFCLIHRLHEVRTCTEKELENGLDGEQLDWVVPDEYKGEIAFSQGFMRNLGGNIRKFDKEI